MIVLRINWNLDLRSPRPRCLDRDKPAWQAKRRELFSRYTLPSLLAQTEPDWQAWLRCDPALEHLTAPMAADLAGIDRRVRVVYDTPAAMAELAIHHDRVTVGRIDSDDMLHPGALARWSSESPGLVQFGHGYALDHGTGRLYEWNHPSSPFIAEIGWRITESSRIGLTGLPGLGGNHGQVYEVARRIDDARWYLVVVHGINICNSLRARWCNRELLGKERAAVLAEFGIADNHQSSIVDRNVHSR
jgi:hypothetical protein